MTDVLPDAAEIQNAFHPRFLELIEPLDEPGTAAGADYAGPWKVCAMDEGFAVLRDWENTERGDRPLAMLTDYEDALRLAAVLPALGCAQRLTLSEPTPGGGHLLREGGAAPAGHLRHFDPALLAALAVAEHLARSPQALAALLESAGPLAIRHVGRLVFERMAARLSNP
jgi:hypothetical protein